MGLGHCLPLWPAGLGFVPGSSTISQRGAGQCWYWGSFGETGRSWDHRSRARRGPWSVQAEVLVGVGTVWPQGAAHTIQERRGHRAAFGGLVGPGTRPELWPVGDAHWLGTRAPWSVLAFVTLVWDDLGPWKVLSIKEISSDFDLIRIIVV